MQENDDEVEQEACTPCPNCDSNRDYLEGRQA